MTTAYVARTSSKLVADTDQSCPICTDNLTDERITSCGHSFCLQCIQMVLDAPIRDAAVLSDEQVQRGVRLCPICRGEIDKTKIFRAEAFMPPAEADDDDDDGVEGEQAEEVDELDENDEHGFKVTRGLKGKKRTVSLVESLVFPPSVTSKFHSHPLTRQGVFGDIKPDIKKFKGKGKAKAEPDEEANQLAEDDNVKGIEDVLPSTKMHRMG
jgi:hypothetical protein